MSGRSVTPEQYAKQKLCGFNTDHTAGYSRSLIKYLAENPICKDAPEYHGYCMKHLPYKLKLQYEWEQTTRTQRQQYLDLIRSGSTIGDAAEQAGISFEAALEVTNRSIDSFSFLKREAE